MKEVLSEVWISCREFWISYSSLDWYDRRIVSRAVPALIGIIIIAFVVAWRLMLPLLLLAIAVVTYLRFTRDKDGL